MKNHIPSIVWIETVVASIAALLAVVSVLWRNWIEGVFGIDPDHHSGSIEWELVVAVCLAAALFAILARRERCRISLPVSAEKEIRRSLAD